MLARVRLHAGTLQRIAALTLTGLSLTGACSVFEDTFVPPPTVLPQCAEPSLDPACGTERPLPCDAACEGGVPDGTCSASVAGEETCLCPDCNNAPVCVNRCFDNGACGVEDTCLCNDCDRTGYCYSLVLQCCLDDGICDPIEGCQCTDCAQNKHCEPLVSACEGGALDKSCGATESCDCPECAAEMRCALELCDGLCLDRTPCICPACFNQCSSCAVDGTCDPLNEGCDCADCKDLPECNQGAGGGPTGAGGTGGAGGSGGI